MTLTRSYTTRRSQPMMRSRLRRPTSKSITAVLWPRSARPEAKLALVVVLPTPPLPEVTTMILAISGKSLLGSKRSGLQSFDEKLLAFEPHLRRLAQHVVGQGGFGGAVDARDGDELRLHAEGEDACLRVAAGAGER